MIKVLGRANSVNVQKVMWCAAELGLDVERSDIGGAFGGNDAADYLLKNPNGRVPTLVDGNYVLWESNAIVRYLCDKYGSSPWMPGTAESRGHANQWMDWYLAELHPPMTTLFWQLVRTSPSNRDVAAIESAIEKCSALWQVLDNHLSSRPYLLGDQLSMADIPVGCSAYRWHCMEFPRPDLPSLRTWWTRLTERPSYKSGVMVPIT
ncbi:MAG: glutathione S-transferase family protein [Roseibium sp.]|uniref:glutathione S-transferase family protein n=1 Tax=Roseibium sp. TaxID=1936156 RepID=UPI002628A572|nr:glutathione S-transferase family protein [Roseibium sp.]MCV0425404.1 glutathione S-transferase family protein [Roseibium sp.]